MNKEDLKFLKAAIEKEVEDLKYDQALLKSCGLRTVGIDRKLRRWRKILKLFPK